MKRYRKRGLSLAILLLAMLVLSVVLTGLLLRMQQARRATAVNLERTQQRYEALGATNLVLERVRQGQDLNSAARAVSEATGREILVAGNRILVPDGAGAVQAGLVPRAWKHALFASTLDLNGVRGAFSKDDPHGPALGTPPSPTATFLDQTRARALECGIHLTPSPAACSFQPGEGPWQATTLEGRPAFVNLTGRGHWVLDGNRWLSDRGEAFEWTGGTWILRAPAECTLEGSILVEGSSLEVRTPLALTGQLVVWNGWLLLKDQVQVMPGPGTLALAVLGQATASAPLDWPRDPLPHPGDLLMPVATARLTVGDLARPEETGGVVLAQARLVKRGCQMRVAGVVAAGRADIDGIAAGDLVWSGRLHRIPPEGLESLDAGLNLDANEVPMR